MWSIGVITYMLLSGSPPFHGKNDQETLKSVKAGVWKWDSRFGPISENAKAFIGMCLTKDVSKRPTAIAAMEHSWFELIHSEETEPISLDIVARLRGMVCITRLCGCVVLH